MNKDALIRDIMTTELVTLKPKDIMTKAKELFLTNNIHHIPIIDENEKVVGIISKIDLERILHGLTFFKTPKATSYNDTILRSLLVEDVMTKNVVTASASNTLSFAANLFKENLFHALPIIDDKGQLTGILTTYDLINYAYSSNPFLR